MIVPGFDDLNIRERPETYKTILKDKYGNNTETTKLRRKMSNAVKHGVICSHNINVIEKGRCAIFFSTEKDYFIIYTINKCYYCDTIETDIENNKAILHKAYELNCVSWIDKGTISINGDEVVRCF